MTALEHLGIVVRNYRISAKLSQEQLSFKADLHRTYIGGIERGERNVSFVNIIALCKALDVKPSDFFQNFDDADHTIILRQANK